MVGDGGLADVIGMHRDLMVSPPQFNFVEDLVPSCNIGKIQHVGQMIGISCVTRLMRRKSLHVRQLPSAFCSGNAQGLLER